MPALLGPASLKMHSFNLDIKGVRREANERMSTRIQVRLVFIHI